MGLFDWKHWLIILIVVILVFGTKRLKNLGSDLGETVKGFRKAMSTEDEPASSAQTPPPPQTNAPLNSQTIDGEARKVEEPVRKD